MSSSIPSMHYTFVQRAALNVSERLALWADASARRREAHRGAPEQAEWRRLHREDAERRREEAIVQRLLLPRQF